MIAIPPAGREFRSNAPWSSYPLCVVPKGPPSIWCEVILFVSIWLALMFVGRSEMFRDPGTFWHVAAGENMLTTGEVIRQDTFSFTRAGQPWVADQWLAECVMAVVHRVAGLDGLLLLAATLLAGVYAWIGGRLIRSGLHIVPAVLLLAVGILIGSPQFHVRPLIVTIVLLGVTFGWLVDFEAGGRRLRQLWWLVPLFILWTNMHGGVLGGLGTVAMCMGGWIVAAAWRLLFGADRLSAARQIAGMAALLIVLIATTLASPYGLSLPREWVETLRMPLPRIIEEHASLAFSDRIGLATLALAAVYLVTLVGVFPRWPRMTWLVPIAWFALAVCRVRNAPLFGITALIALADMLRYSRVGWWLEGRDMIVGTRGLEETVEMGRSLLPRWFPGTSSVPICCVVVAAALLLQIGEVGMPVIGHGWVKIDSMRMPVDLLPALRKINRSSEPGTRIFNDLRFGGFLIYYTPRLRVFVDDRCPLYGSEFLLNYDRSRLGNPSEIERWRLEYGFGHAMVETGGMFDGYLSRSAGWNVVERSPAATLYRHE